MFLAKMIDMITRSSVKRSKQNKTS